MVLAKKLRAEVSELRSTAASHIEQALDYWKDVDLISPATSMQPKL
jgi:hypothetical protein